MTQEKTALKDRVANVVEMTKERIGEVSDKVKSGLHEVKSEVAPNFIEKTTEGVKARVDDLKSKVHETKADERTRALIRPLTQMSGKQRGLLLLTALGLGAFFVVKRRRAMA